MFMQILEAERKSRNFTQRQMAKRLGYCERTYSAYIGGNPLTVEAMNRIAGHRDLRSPRLALCTIASQDNPFAPRMLDVDMHHAVELLVVTDEMREALDAIGAIDPCKPLARSDVRRVVDQALDLIHAIPHLLIALAEASALDLWEAARINASKLEARGYIRREERGAA